MLPELRNGRSNPNAISIGVGKAQTWFKFRQGPRIRRLEMTRLRGPMRVRVSLRRELALLVKPLMNRELMALPKESFDRFRR